MPQPTCRVDQIDHVEVFVPDQYEAAKRYEVEQTLVCFLDDSSGVNSGTII